VYNQTGGFVMLKAVLKKGTIVPLEPLPPEWEEGATLEVARVEAPSVDIDAWAQKMSQLCADSQTDDENAMRRAIEEQRREAKERTRREMGLSA
jgi:hypothetical protein